MDTSPTIMKTLVASCCASPPFNDTGDSRDPAEAQVYNSKMTTAEFAELAKLCRDPNVLGGNLLSMAKTLSDHPTPQSKSVSSI